SVTSFNNHISGKYGYAQIPDRYKEILMPEVHLVDLREQHRKKIIKGHFSLPLLEAIHETLTNEEQVILFQNRRGYSPIVECKTCGHIPQCQNCDVSLTYHQYRGELRCHYCGYHETLEAGCVACGNQSLDTKGLGTEQVEAELGTLLPDARVMRMDYDTTRGKHSYSKIITAFEKREIDILVGTQMVTKGLDFRHVNLVGIMNADTLLNFPDYRAHERGFQLLMQVAGRAGRTKKQGQVIIQTYQPVHPVLTQVLHGDYEAMFARQMEERKQFRYPPAYRIIRIEFKHKEYQRVQEGASWFARALRQEYSTHVLGPESPLISRLRNQYIKQLLIKIPLEMSLAKTKNSIKRIERSFNAISLYRSIRVIYHADHI
ncbi:MAG: primosomal protein N', partial [Flavobacteriaceae bacterium]|nr:primosomal protein N' [Flavobacteriaceae bacterium]